MKFFSITRRRVIVALGTGVLVLGVAGSVLAASPTPTPTPGDGVQTAPWSGCSGTGMSMVGAIQDVAKLLGLTPEELQTQLQSGKSLAAIAREKGVSTDKLVTAIMATHQAQLDAQVKNGVLTQQQADQTLQTIKTHIPAMVESSGGMGAGMMGGAMPGGSGTGMMGGAMHGGTGAGMMGGAMPGGSGTGLMSGAMHGGPGMMRGTWSNGAASR